MNYTTNISIAELKYLYNKLHKQEVPKDFDFESFLMELSKKHGKEIRWLVKGFDLEAYLDDPAQYLAKARA